MSEFSSEMLQTYPFSGMVPPLKWELVALEAISEDVSPGFASGKHSSDGSGVPHLRPMNVDRDGEIDLTIVKSVAESNGVELRSGDVLFNNTNSAELVGKTAVVSARESGFAYSNHMTRVRPETGVNSAFVARQLHFLWMTGYMKHRCTNHVNQASIASKTLAKTIPILLPPQAEQTRIVAKLEELLSDIEAGVAELKAAQKKLQKYRQSVLKAAVEGALTAPWREAQRELAPFAETAAQLLQRILTERRARWEAKQLAKFKEQGKAPPKDWQKKYPEPIRPDTTDLPVLPEGWAWASVDQCSFDENAITDGPFGSNLKSEHYQDSGPRVIRLQNIGDGIFINAYAHISEAHFANLSKHSVETGDVVVAMLGEVLPRACAIPDGVAPAIVKADCARVRLNTKLVCPDIVVAQLNSKPVRDAVMKFVKGVGRPRINLGHVRAVPIALAPSDEQVAIEKTLQKAQLSIEEQLSAIDLSLRQSVAQRQNILSAAFSGQLVPQDPNDEPASMLLERIRAEKAERAKQPKARKTKQKKEIAAVASQLIDVLAGAGDWVPAQEAFRRCGVADGALTNQIEALYAELRALDKAGRLAVEPVTDAQGRKLYDKLKLLAD
ncbi:TPA: restriction endonuclease subunit S [Burkholderia vietnamiensis]|nr:restriction endonuclease subunit S [Burkholderia vietnamiensis]